MVTKSVITDCISEIGGSGYRIMAVISAIIYREPGMGEMISAFYTKAMQ
jgi:hypothetical protein